MLGPHKGPPWEGVEGGGSAGLKVWVTDGTFSRLPGGVHLQRCADDASHHGKLRLPQVGPGRGLAHGSVFHGPHPRVHGLHVPHLKGLPEAGKCFPTLGIHC